MERLCPLLLLAACAATPRSDYVPGGRDLPARARAAYARAVERERHGEPERALAILSDLCLQYPLRVGLHLMRLRLAARVRGADYAAGLYDPPPPGVDAERAGVLAALARLSEDDLAGRRAMLDFAAKQEPNEPFWLLGLAEVDLAAYEDVSRRAGSERALGRVQDAANSLVEAGGLLQRAEDLAAAALRLDPDLVEGHLLLGYMQTRRADLEETYERRDAWRNRAQAHYERALAIDPANVTALLNLAENHLYFDRYTEAVRALRQAAALAPVETRAHTNLGYAYYATGRLEEAIASYRRALAVEPGEARARTALADCLRGTGQADDAVEELARARSDAGGDPELLAEIAFKLGAIHEQEKRYREAVEEYRRHIELGGKDAPKARSRLRHIYEGAFDG